MLTICLKIKALFFFPLLLFLSCCDSSQQPEHRILFSLGYGKLEDQISFDLQSATLGYFKRALYFRNGLFYVLDQKGRKIQKFNSYGDLLTLYYNDKYNPEPFLTKGAEQGNSGLNAAYVFPFSSANNFLVAENDELIVDNLIDKSQRFYNSEQETYHERIILRISAIGELKHYIGEEGVGGTPFAPIIAMDFTVEQELLLVCRDSRGWRLFAFDSNDNLIKNKLVVWQELFQLAEDGFNASLRSLLPSRGGREFVFLIDFHPKVSVYGENEEIPQTVSRIYTYNLQEETFSAGYDLIFDKPQTEYYRLLSTGADGSFYLISDWENSRKLLIIDPDGIVRYKQTLLSTEKLVFDDSFFVSENNLLVAAFAGEKEIEFHWWRTDKLLF